MSGLATVCTSACLLLVVQVVALLSGLVTTCALCLDYCQKRLGLLSGLVTTCTIVKTIVWTSYYLYMCQDY